MKKIAVYGSLRKGMYNHSLLENEGAKYIETKNVEIPYKMVPYSSFPALIPDSENCEVQMEIYEVDAPTYKRVEILEGYPRFYDKATFKDDKDNDVEFYYIPDKNDYLKERFSDVQHIVDWVTFFKNNFKIQD